jgi:hypothetical protein
MVTVRVIGSVSRLARGARQAPSWTVLLGHFAKRKIELGTCGRAYATNCQHEFACIRCPMLRPDPAQHQRLEEIIASLGERLAEAHERGWLGEVEGLQTSLDAAEQKLVQMRRTTINLGLPTIPAGRTRRNDMTT